MSISSVIRLIVACAVSLSAGLIGSLAVADNFTTWYSAIEKPLFTPPNWVFGPVWGILYLLMGVGAFLWSGKKDSGPPPSKRPLCGSLSSFY